MLSQLVGISVTGIYGGIDSVFGHLMEATEPPMLRPTAFWGKMWRGHPFPPVFGPASGAECGGLASYGGLTRLQLVRLGSFHTYRASNIERGPQHDMARHMEPSLLLWVKTR